MSSEGVILIYGRDETAIEAGRLLADHLDVSVMITRPAQIAPPATTSFPIVKGTIRSAKGHFGKFELTIDDYAAPRIELPAPGLLNVPSRPGLGYQVDHAKVRRYQVRQREFTAKTTA